MLRSAVISVGGLEVSTDDIPGLREMAAGGDYRFRDLPDPAGFARDCLLRFEMMDLTARYGAKPELTVDGVALLSGVAALELGAPEEDRTYVVAIKRGREPFRGDYALPGGFVDLGEATESAVIREFSEETGLDAVITGLIGVYSDPTRDPRWHHVSAAYTLEVIGGKLQGGDDAESAHLLPVSPLPELAFDHSRILGDALEIGRR